MSTVDLNTLMVCWPTSLSSSSVTVIILHFPTNLPNLPKTSIYWQRADLNIFLYFQKSETNCSFVPFHICNLCVCTDMRVPSLIVLINHAKVWSDINRPT